MANFNQWIGAGTLVRDPEIRYTGSGQAVTKFRMAVNPNKSNAKPEDTLFIDIVAFDKLAETCNTYLKKGSGALVQGRLQIRQYDDKDGNKRQATEIVISTMQMLDKKGNASSNGAPVGAGVGASESSDEEIPFD